MKKPEYKKVTIYKQDHEVEFELGGEVKDIVLISETMVRINKIDDSSILYCGFPMVVLLK